MNCTKVNSSESLEFINDYSVPEPSTFLLVAAGVIYSCTFIFGIIGNISVIAVIHSTTSIQNRMTYMFVNLSVSDLLICMICLPSGAVDLFSKEVWYFGEFLCKFIPFIENTVTVASAVFVLTIAYERFKGICSITEYETSNMHTSLHILLPLLWGVACVSSIPLCIMTVYHQDAFLDGTPVTVCSTPIDQSWKTVYIISNFVFFFGLTCFALIYLTCTMSRELSRSEISASCDAMTRRNRVAPMLIVVLVTFVICLFPFKVFVLWLSLTDENNIAYLGYDGYINLLTFTRALTYMHSACNPIIYGGMSKKFRTTFRSLYRQRYSKQSKNNGFQLHLLPVTANTR